MHNCQNAWPSVPHDIGDAPDDIARMAWRALLRRSFRQARNLAACERLSELFVVATERRYRNAQKIITVNAYVGEAAADD